MSTEHPEGGQPVGQLSPDGRWRWDGHNWIPAQQVPAGGQAGQAAWPQGGQQQYGAQQYGAQQHPQQQAPYPYPPSQQYGGGMPPGAVQPKKGLPTWAKVLLTLLVLFVGLIALLTIVGLTMEEDYADWSCEDVAEEAVKISDENGGVLVLQDVTELEATEDNRTDFSAPSEGRGVVLACEGTGQWSDLGDAPVLVELAATDDGDEWVRYEMID